MIHAILSTIPHHYHTNNGLSISILYVPLNLQDEQQCLYVKLQESKEKLQSVEKEQTAKLASLLEEHGKETAKSAKEDKKVADISRKVLDACEGLQALEREQSVLEGTALKHTQQLQSIRRQKDSNEVARLQAVEQAQETCKTELAREILTLQEGLGQVEQEERELQCDVEDPERAFPSLDNLLLGLGSRERVEFEKYLQQRILEQLDTLQVGLYVYMYICVYVYMCVYMCICMSACV